MKLNVKAAELRTELFELVGKFKSLTGAAWATGDVDAHAELDAVACALADIDEKLPYIFIDAYCDEKDQAHNVVLPKAWH